MKISAENIIDKLKLKPHPEGGYYHESYKSSGMVPEESLGDQFSGARHYSTAIYFLLTEGNFSAFHRIKQDELWHHYLGDSIYVDVISKNGTYTRHEVGIDIMGGSKPQLVVEAGSWFASSVKKGGSLALVGCTVAPGFDFRDFELAQREELCRAYPQHRDIITEFTRQ